MLQVNILVQVLDSLDVVVGQAELSQQVDVLEPLDSDDVVVREVQDFQVVQFTNLEHPDQVIVRHRKLKETNIVKKLLPCSNYLA